MSNIFNEYPQKETAQPLYDFNLLKTLCEVHATSGNETSMKNFLVAYVEQHKHTWKVQPQIIADDTLQDAVLLVFGTPRTAVFAHMDSIGYMVRYGKELVRIGGSRSKDGYKLQGQDSNGKISCTLKVVEDASDEKDKKIVYEADRELDRGTNLVFECDFRETEDSITSCYLDNRLGCWVALQVAETLENGIIAFTSYEEVGGGNTTILARRIYEDFNVKQALICDITWITTGIIAGKGVAISMRDTLVPRRSYIKKIIELAKQTTIPYQLEVETTGNSDGKELQNSPYPFDWCFIGAGETNVHTPNEEVHKTDIHAMVCLYKHLLNEL